LKLIFRRDYAEIRRFRVLILRGFCFFIRLLPKPAAAGVKDYSHRLRSSMTPAAYTGFTFLHEETTYGGFTHENHSQENFC
jgi:hypothetical protein